MVIGMGNSLRELKEFDNESGIEFFDDIDEED